MNWDRTPISLEDFQFGWLERGANKYFTSLFSFAAFAWTIWKIRNKMAIEKSFPKKPIVAVFKSLSCLQRWSLLLKGKERQELDAVINSAENWMKTFTSDHAL